MNRAFNEPLSPDDERYRIPGTTILNFTAWSRENEPKDPPKFWLGHRVRFIPDDGDVVEGVIEACYPDCDWTPLYDVKIEGGHVHGVSDDSLEACS